MSPAAAEKATTETVFCLFHWCRHGNEGGANPGQSFGSSDGERFNPGSPQPVRVAEKRFLWFMVWLDAVGCGHLTSRTDRQEMRCS